MKEKELNEVDKQIWPFMVLLENRKTGERWEELYMTREEAKEGVFRAKNKATHYAIWDHAERKFTHHSKDFFDGPKRRA